jgi:MFS family permease
VLLLTQLLSMLQSALLALFAFTHLISVWHVLALSAFQGVINAFDTPARQSFVVEMVEAREDLANAIALNSSMMNGARLIGPSIAGVLIALFGEAWCFALDALSYVAVVASLLAMQVRPRERPRAQERFLTDLAAGFRYAAGFARSCSCWPW